MMTKNKLKTSVSPIIYNNGNRNIALKTYKKEVFKMQKELIINDELKNLLISDKEIEQFFTIFLLNNVYKQEDPKEYDTLTYNNFNLFKSIIYDDIKSKDRASLKNSLLEVYNELLSNDLINDVIQDYTDLALYEGKNLLNTISRLLYLQDKYKDKEIGQEIDKKIKEWINYINEWDKIKFTDIIEDDEISLNKFLSQLFYRLIPSLNYDIYYNDKDRINFIPRRDFLDLFNYKIIKQEDLKNIIKDYIENKINDSKFINRLNNNINSFLDQLLDSENIDKFMSDKEDTINNIKKKYNIKDLEEEIEKEKALNYKINNNTYLKDLVNDNITSDPYIDDLYNLYNDFIKENNLMYDDTEDKKVWTKKADIFINKLIKFKDKVSQIDYFDINFTFNELAYNNYQKDTYIINNEKKEIKGKTKDNRLFQSTAKQLKAIDNARGGLVTYNETNTQTIINAIREKQESLKNTHIKEDKARLKKEIDKLNQELIKAEQKEKELKEEYKNVCDYLNNIYKSMANEPKTSSYYKDLKKAKKTQEQRKKEIEQIIKFNGWQLDLWGNGSYELVLNKKKKESLKLTIENLSKQIAKYTKEEQDIFDYLISKYLHNTDNKEVKFTLREYEETKHRVRPDKYLLGDIQAIRLLFREVWTYITTDDKTYSFNEKHLFNNLNIKGELESDLNNLNNANLDTEISLELTETLQTLLKDHDNYLYISTPMEILQLNNDNEYLAKRLLKYLNYLARVNKTSVIEISLDAIIEDLQHYGLKNFNMLNSKKTYKTEIVDVIDKTLSVLEGENKINKKFIEVLDREPFIIYDREFRGKSQETSINEWGKYKLLIKVFNLNDNKLLETKEKQKKNKKKTTKK